MTLVRARHRLHGRRERPGSGAAVADIRVPRRNRLRRGVPLRAHGANGNRAGGGGGIPGTGPRMSRPDSRSEEHTSELQSLMRISSAVFFLKKTNLMKNYTKREQPY